MSDYVTNLRKKIGHDPILIPHSIVILYNENDEILIEERSDDGNFDFPGGGIEPDEEAEEAAKRELFEETGLIADELEFFKLYTGKITYYKYSNGDEIYGIDMVYIAKKYHGTLKRQVEEVNNLLFIKGDDIPRNKLSPRNKQILIDLKKRRK